MSYYKQRNEMCIFARNLEEKKRRHLFFFTLVVRQIKILSASTTQTTIHAPYMQRDILSTSVDALRLCSDHTPDT